MNPTTNTVDEISLILKLLGDKTRLTIVKLLDKQECCVCELVEIFKASQPAISQHLRKLKDAGLIKENRKGQWIFYSLNTDFKYWQLAQEIMKHVPSVDYLLEELSAKGLKMTCD